MTATTNADTWTVRRVLDWTRGHFEKNEVDAPRLTAELLLSHILKLTRVKLYTDLDRPLQKDELATYRGLIQRRMAGEPTQYLTGSTQFFNRAFAVDQRVLIPRPETELLLEAILSQLPKDSAAKVLDVCTGSGCLAISIALERPATLVTATDISDEALAVARGNADALRAAERVTFLQGDLLAPHERGSRFDVVVSNPPYVRSADLATLQREVQREPKLALDGGADGLSFYQRLASELKPHLAPGALVALEIGEDQGSAVRALFEKQGFNDVRVEKDLERRERMVFARAP